MPDATVRSLDLQQGLRQQHLRLTCCALFLMALLTLWPGRAAHAAQPWREALPAQIQTVGSGTMTWLGFRIYQATLWAAQKPLDESQPFALQLDYKVKISRDKLASTSIEEIQRMSPAPIAGPTLARWKSELNRAFVDVADGDELVGVYLPQRGMRLYDRDKMLAEIADPELARSFFNIWLGQPSRDESLRRRLLGETP
ncbi:chalcone isomerase family protein [Herbaspirillum huttiense F1]|jgi:hypothetical protein|uniref:Chalcone isomerase family protein n=1 Tax=Herbaspirillum huttiense subsp. lycopersici TaxID=3074428 RepID=A0ABU2EK31_9BURK|nr:MULTISPECIES: chalcone isomerase family protein [Herbaspirillum]MBP1316883.1 hypothetical protein [Herbaspirillum sp. 1130]MDR6740173.1 hypothetical protein [Herbaspirillum sp. 1173]MDR9848505.1 chalcone isomerase family protein [Herbaspirillum huttiense SE1]MDT0356221.1 chalcone isomerase family protein [Herbaspirillum huttiense F1]